MIELLLIAAPLDEPQPAAPCEGAAHVQVFEEHRIVGFLGRLDECTVDILIEAFDAYESVKWFNIASTGGDHREAMRLARAIKDRKLIVHVTSFCLSACAHFAILGGRYILISESGYLAYSGNFLGRSLNPTLTNSLNARGVGNFNEITTEIVDFYREMDVDP